MFTKTFSFLKNKISANANVVSIMFLLALSVFSVFSWIPKGEIWGGADVGIPVYSPENQLTTVASSWWEKHATGETNSMTYTSIPFYTMLSVANSVGLTPEFNQKFFIFLILFGGSVAFYFLAFSFGFSKKTGLLAALFSLYNFNTLSVWHRGVHNGMLMLLFIPVSLLILEKGVSRRSFLSIIVLNVFSFIMSYVYGAPGFTVAIWILWMAYFVFQFLKGDKTQRKFVLVYALITVVSWLLLNAWWILHFIESGKFIIGSFSASDLLNRTVDVVIGLKRQTENAFVIRGLSRFYLYDTKDWGELYSNPFFIFLSWIPTIIIFLTTLFKKNHSSRIWTWLMLLVVITLSISKGVNPPLGWLAKFLFEKLSFLAPLRNPYEKVGILLILPYSFLFGLGLSQIFNWFKKAVGRFAVPFLVAVIFVSCCVLVWPMWLGQTFIVPDYNYLISVPDYYNQAERWLKERSNDARILHLPIAPNESVDYNWGFTGGVPSQVFFSGSSLAYMIGVPSVDFQLNNLISLIHNEDTGGVKKLFGSLNVGWIVVHNETQSQRRKLESLDKINDWLKSAPEYLEHEIDFGPLSIWKVALGDKGRHFYSPYAPFTLIEGTPDTMYSYWKNQTGEDSMFVVSNSQDSDIVDKLNSAFFSEQIYPVKTVKYSDQKTVDTGTLPYVSKLPGSPLYPFIRFKEFVEKIYTNKPPLIECLDFASKRLSEAVALKDLNINASKSSMEEYKNILENCSFLAETSPLSGWSVNRLLLYDNLYALQNNFGLYGKDDILEESVGLLKKIMYIFEVSPSYDRVITDDNSNVIAYTYQVLSDGVYSLEFDEYNLGLFSTPRLVKINDRGYNLEPEVEENKLTFPNLSLKAGNNEVQIKYFNKNIFSIDRAKFINATVTNNKVVGEGYVIDVSSEKDRLGKFEFSLGNVKDIYSYDIVSDYFVERGSAPVVKVNQDSDYVDSETEIEHGNTWPLDLSVYNRHWLHRGNTYIPSGNANSAVVRFELPLWNDCTDFNSKSACKNKDLYKIFDRPSKVVLKNIQIIANYDSYPTLNREILNSGYNLHQAVLTYTKITSEEYRLGLSEQQAPYVIVFSETYHPQWKVFSGDGKEIHVQHFQANGYANGWLVEENLPDTVFVKFGLEKYRRYGNIVSGLSLIVLLPLIIYINRRSNNVFKKVR